MPSRLEDVVSPELALVDHELAARARQELPDLELDCLAADPPDEAAATQATSPGWRDRVATTPAVTLLATAAASLVVTAFTAHDSARGEGPLVFEVVREPALPAQQASVVGGTDNSPTASTRRQPTIVASGRRPSSVQAPRDAATTLVWPGAPQAIYDVELVRRGNVIYSSRSTSSHVAVPATWQHEGVSYSIRENDRASVWRVVNGRRASPAVVDGVLAVDMAPISRFMSPS